MYSLLTFSLLFWIKETSAQFPFNYLSKRWSDFSSYEYLRVPRSEDGDTDYRLPTTLDPIHYVLDITPYFEAETVTDDDGTVSIGKEAFTFDGIVTIVVKVMGKNVCELVLHEKVKDILEVKVIDGNGQSVNLDPSSPFERIEKYNILKINLDQEALIKHACYNITVQYTGIMTDDFEDNGLMRGCYRGDDGKTHWYAATLLQPKYTRFVFPSFDEPGFKSTFSIIVNRPVMFSPTYSNMKIAEEIPCDDRIKEIFHVTPRMSSYLVSLLISEEFKVIADNNNATHPFRVIARPNAVGQGDHALEIGPKVIAGLVDYLGIDSYTMAENINEDHIAVPNYPIGGMESWGSIIYRMLREAIEIKKYPNFNREDGWQVPPINISREMSMLYEFGEENKRVIEKTVIHEISHKYFGNLVTCRWWDNTWLNEGFATFFESVFFEVVGVTNAFMLTNQIALMRDSYENTNALQRNVNMLTDTTTMVFDIIAYKKGAAFLTMLRELVTEDSFKKALNKYLVDNAYEYVEPEDLYTSFACILQDQKPLPSNIEIRTFMKTWVEEPGHPLINVKINSETGLISLQQERFMIEESATPSEQIWPVPLTFTTGADPDWDNLTPSHVMTDKCLDIQGTPGEHWVIFNKQQRGFYRVNYDTGNWQTIIQTLKEIPERIHPLNRAQIVADVFALMVSKKITFEFGFQIIDFLKQETNYHVWITAKMGFKLFLDNFFHLSDARIEFLRVIQTFLGAVVSDVGFDDKDNEPRVEKWKRIDVLDFACSVRHDACIQGVLAKFNALKTADSSELTDSYVYYTGVREGDYEDWSYVNHLRECSNNQMTEVVRFLMALTKTKNERALQELLDIVLGIHKYLALVMLDEMNKESAPVMLKFTKQRIEDVRNTGIPVDQFLASLAMNLNAEQLNDMEQWLCENEASIPEYAAGMKAVEAARSRLQRGWPDADRILAAARGAGTHSGVPTLTTLVKNFVSTGFSILSKIYNDLRFRSNPDS